VTKATDAVGSRSGRTTSDPAGRTKPRPLRSDGIRTEREWALTEIPSAASRTAGDAAAAFSGPGIRPTRNSR